MATLTLPTDNILMDPDLYTFCESVKTNVDNTFASAPVVVTDAAAYTVLAANTGKLHVVPDCSQGTTMTLPANVAGLKFKFIYGGAAADASNHIFVPTAGFYIGAIEFHDTQADATTPVFSDGNSNDVFTIVTPGAYSVEFHADGTNWYVSGWVGSATVCTMAD